MIVFGVLNPEKIWHRSLYIWPAYLYTVATLPWEIQKKSFLTVLFVHTSDYLLSQKKQTVAPLPTAREKRHHTTL